MTLLAKGGCPRKAVLMPTGGVPARALAGASSLSEAPTSLPARDPHHSLEKESL